MSKLNAKLTTELVQQAWLGFQREALAIEVTSQGLVVALPRTFPDGWQMVVELHPGPHKKVKLTDGGRSLGWLSARGQNVSTDAVMEHLQEICCLNGIERDGWELFRWLDLPIQAVDIHVFAEALTSVAHLYYLHEPIIRSIEAADRSLRRIFTDRKLTAIENHLLNGKTERGLRVDYYLSLSHPVAFQVLRRHGRIQSTMEQWGYRWQDLRKMNPLLKPAMIYDPAVQNVDEAARAIGNEVCDLFCGYQETDRIHQLLDEANH